MAKVNADLTESGKTGGPQSENEGKIRVCYTRDQPKSPHCDNPVETYHPLETKETGLDKNKSKKI